MMQVTGKCMVEQVDDHQNASRCEKESLTFCESCRVELCAECATVCCLEIFCPSCYGIHLANFHQ